MFLKAAINGARTRAEHPAVPLTLDEIVHDVRSVVAAGADVVHTHTFDPAGRQTVDPKWIQTSVERFRADLPGIAVGTTVGLWTCASHLDRMRAIDAWTAPPDFVAVNYREEGADEATSLLVERGVPVETAVWSLDDMPALLESVTLDQHIRVLVEPETADPVEAVAVCREATRMLRSAGLTAPILYHGDGPTVWPVVRAAIVDGAQTRVGFEDGIHLPDGSVASDNAELVAAARSEACRLLGDPAAESELVRHTE